MPDTQPEAQTVQDAVLARLASIEVERKALGAERHMLLRLLAHYGSQSNGEAPPSTPRAGVAATAAKAPKPAAEIRTMGLTKAVRTYLRQHPGYTAPQVIDVLDGVVKTTSQEPRKIISWTIGELVRRKEFVRRDDGTLYPTVKEESTIGLL